MLATRVIDHMNNRLMVFTIHCWIDGVLYTKTERDVLESAMIRLRNRYIKHYEDPRVPQHFAFAFASKAWAVAKVWSTLCAIFGKYCETSIILHHKLVGF